MVAISSPSIIRIFFPYQGLKKKKKVVQRQIFEVCLGESLCPEGEPPFHELSLALKVKWMATLVPLDPDIATASGTVNICHLRLSC